MGFDLYVALFDVSQYRLRVEPTLRKYFETGECRDVLLLLNDIDGFSGNDLEIIRSSIDILSRNTFYNPSVNHQPLSFDSRTSREDMDKYVLGTVVSQLLQGLCVPHNDGEARQQNMGRGALIPYLYKHSPWIEDAFTGGILDQGVALDFPIGEHAEILTSSMVERLVSELNSVPRPDPDTMPSVSKQFSNLYSILQTAVRDTKYAILLYVS